MIAWWNIYKIDILNLLTWGKLASINCLFVIRIGGYKEPQREIVYFTF